MCVELEKVHLGIAVVSGLASSWRYLAHCCDALEAVAQKTAELLEDLCQYYDCSSAVETDYTHHHISALGIRHERKHPDMHDQPVEAARKDPTQVQNAYVVIAAEAILTLNIATMLQLDRF